MGLLYLNLAAGLTLIFGYVMLSFVDKSRAYGVEASSAVQSLLLIQTDPSRSSCNPGESAGLPQNMMNRGVSLFASNWSATVEATTPDGSLITAKELAMTSTNYNTLSSCAPLPAYCQVLSVSRLVARGHNSQTDPWVPVGATVKVEAVQSYGGYTIYARFTYNGVQCHLPITDLQELFLSDGEETLDNLWAEFKERLSRLPASEAIAEMESVEKDIQSAGGSEVVAIVFLSSALSTMRASL